MLPGGSRFYHPRSPEQKDWDLMQWRAVARWRAKRARGTWAAMEELPGAQRHMLKILSSNLGRTIGGKKKYVNNFEI